MNKYINADSLLTKIKAYRPYMYLGEDALSYSIKMVELEPTADVRENVRGEWLNMERIEDDKAEYVTEWQQAQCSVCHKWHTTPYMYFFTHYNFCPFCGAQMER